MVPLFFVYFAEYFINQGLVSSGAWRSLACVASVPVRTERNIGPREGVFAFRTRGKWGGSKKDEGKMPHFPRVLNAKTPSRGPIFRSVRTGTLATQARRFRGLRVSRVLWTTYLECGIP